MRLWSIHPHHLDRQGLTACWREALLAQAVLAGRTAGYRNHPQLERFRSQPKPLASVGRFLLDVAEEASSRGYRFNRARIDVSVEAADAAPRIPATAGQIDFEWSHLLAKLERRTPDLWERQRDIKRPDLHPLFVLRPGEIEPWERGAQ